MEQSAEPCTHLTPSTLRTGNLLSVIRLTVVDQPSISLLQPRCCGRVLMPIRLHDEDWRVLCPFALS